MAKAELAQRTAEYLAHIDPRALLVVTRLTETYNVIPEVGAEFDHPTFRRIFDLGTHTGEFLYLLDSIAEEEVDSLDYDSIKVEIALDRQDVKGLIQQQRLRLHCWNAMRIPELIQNRHAVAGSYDLVTAIELYLAGQEGFPGGIDDVAKVTGGVNGLLSPGGIHFFTVRNPDERVEAALQSGMWDASSVTTALKGLSINPQSMEEVMRSHGFGNVSWRGQWFLNPDNSKPTPVISNGTIINREELFVPRPISFPHDGPPSIFLIGACQKPV